MEKDNLQKLLNEINISLNKDKVKKEQDKKEQQKKAKTKKNNEDFKRKYFDYYDDIKISDRQDW